MRPRCRYRAAFDDRIRAGYWVPERPETAAIDVRWAEGIGLPDRWELERRLGLTFATARGNGWWGYRLPDSGSKSIETLIEDPAVVDTKGIDRARFTPETILKDDVPSRAGISRGNGRHRGA